MKTQDELVLWSAGAWLQVSGFTAQSLVVTDVQDQVEQGKPLDKVLAEVPAPKKHAGDFGIEIVGSLLAPIVIGLLKDFWSGYLKKLSDKAEGDLADATVGKLKSVFAKSLADKNEDAYAILKSDLERLEKENKLTPKQAQSLLETLQSTALVDELASSKS
jgi:hypothetical protein